MPSAFLVDPIRRLVLSRCWDVLTGDEVLAMLDGTAKDPHFRVDFAQLADMSAVTQLDVSTNIVHFIAATSPFREGSKRALVAGIDVVYGMARIYKTIAEQRPGEFTVFRDIQPAIAWLGFGDEEETLCELLAALPPIAAPKRQAP